jgi:integrase
VAEFGLRQARKIADEFLRPLNLGKVTPFSALTFREFVEQYFVPNALPTLKVSTQGRYRRTLKTHLLPAFGNSRLSDIGNLNVQQFVLQKMASGLGWGCADHFRNLMSKIFATAKKWGYFPGDNPAAGVELPEKIAVREKHALTGEQIPPLLAALREPVRTMALVGLLTGLRVGEILALRWQDVDFDAGQVHVRQACYRGSIGSPKTKGSKRILPLPDALREALTRTRKHCVRQSAEDLVFQTRNGTTFSDTNLLHRDLKPAGRQIGASWLSWHAFRRTHATLLQHAGGSLKDAQAQLGHSKLSTTLELYTVPIPEHQREAVEKMSAGMVTNGDESGRDLQNLPMPTTQIQ